MSPAIFRGRFEHAIDPKGRLSIPAKFREVIEQRHDGRIIITNLPKCLVAYTPEEWEAIEAKASRLPTLKKPNVQAYLRFFISGATECEIDGQGRILIPPTLRSHAALERHVVLVALTNRFEIWNRERLEEEKRFFSDDQIADDLADLGL
jgi:MraZ protein